MAAATNVLLITGSPGVGKTTLVKKAVQALAGRNLAGFYTEEMRAGKVRDGFALVTLRGERLIMAHVGHPSAHRVGRYGVDVQAIDTAVELSLSEDRGAELFVIDEIGKMECFSALFVKKVSILLDSGKSVVATIAQKGGGFISQVKNREGVELWEVTRKNRDEMAGKVVSWVGERLPRRARNATRSRRTAMNLYLVQHGEALTKEIDPERPLSERGIQDATKGARFAAKNCAISLSAIHHSGKLRAFQTAAIFAERFGLPEPAAIDGLAPLDDPGVWASALQERTDNLMLVGHLPHLARLTGALLCGRSEASPVRFQMGGIAALAREEGRWSLQWMLVPDLLPEQCA